MEPGFEPADITEGEGQEIEEEGPVCFRGKADHLASGLGIRFPVDELKVGGLAAQARAIVNDLAVDFSG